MLKARSDNVPLASLEIRNSNIPSNASCTHHVYSAAASVVVSVDDSIRRCGADFSYSVFKERDDDGPKAARTVESFPVRLPPHGPLGGGADGDRTHDLRLAKPALSQLSYGPVGRPGCSI